MHDQSESSKEEAAIGCANGRLGARDVTSSCKASVPRQLFIRVRLNTTQSVISAEVAGNGGWKTATEGGSGMVGRWKSEHVARMGVNGAR